MREMQLLFYRFLSSLDFYPNYYSHPNPKHKSKINFRRLVHYLMMLQNLYTQQRGCLDLTMCTLKPVCPSVTSTTQYLRDAGKFAPFPSLFMLLSICSLNMAFSLNFLIILSIVSLLLCLSLRLS